MIGLIITFLVAPAVWLALEVCRAPLAIEGPNGLCVIEPGHCWIDRLPGLSDHVDPFAFWGLG